MSYVPCRDCRRHVRTDAACCPFCGGDKSEPRPEIAPEVALSRGAMAVIAGTGVAIAFEVSACGVYGGPPPRIAEPRAPARYLDVPRTDTLEADDAEQSLVRRARAAGCEAEWNRREQVILRCGDVYFEATAGAHDWSLICTSADQAACRPTFERVLRVRDPRLSGDAGSK